MKRIGTMDSLTLHIFSSGRNMRHWQICACCLSLVPVHSVRYILCCHMVGWSYTHGQLFQLLTVPGKKKKKETIPVTGRQVPGFCKTFSGQSTHRWCWLCQPYAPVALNPPGRFLVLISVRGSVYPKAIVRLEGLGHWKIQWPHRESNSRLPEL
jgi:hypothetical protein